MAYVLVDELHRLQGEVSALERVSCSAAGVGSVHMLRQDSVAILVSLLLALVILVLLCFRKHKRIQRFFTSNTRKDLSVYAVNEDFVTVDKAKECWVGDSPEQDDRSNLLLEMENRIVLLGQTLLELAIGGSLWQDGKEVIALREWAAAHAELTAEMVLEAALRRLEIAFAEETQLREDLEALSGSLPKLGHEQHLLNVAALDLEKQVSQTLASSSSVCVQALREQIEELQAQLAFAVEERDAARSTKAALERRASEASILESRLDHISREHEAIKSANLALERRAETAVALNARLTKVAEEHQKLKEEGANVSMQTEKGQLQQEETQRQLRSARRKLRDSEARLADTERQLKARIAELEARSIELETELASAHEDRNASAAARAEMERGIAYYTEVAENLAGSRHRLPEDLLRALDATSLRACGDSAVTPQNQMHSPPNSCVLPGSGHIEEPWVASTSPPPPQEPVIAMQPPRRSPSHLDLVQEPWATSPSPPLPQEPVARALQAPRGNPPHLDLVQEPWAASPSPPLPQELVSRALQPPRGSPPHLDLGQDPFGVEVSPQEPTVVAPYQPQRGSPDPNFLMEPVAAMPLPQEPVTVSVASPAPQYIIGGPGAPPRAWS